MLHLLMGLMLAGAPVPTGGPERMMFRDPSQGPTPVEDKTITPSRPPDCQTPAQTKHAVQQVRNGELGDCFVKDPRAFNDHGG